MKYEYKSVKMNIFSEIDLLNQLGDNGWNFIAFSESQNTALFKRKVNDDIIEQVDNNNQHSHDVDNIIKSTSIANESSVKEDNDWLSSYYGVSSLKYNIGADDTTEDGKDEEIGDDDGEEENNYEDIEFDDICFTFWNKKGIYIEFNNFDMSSGIVYMNFHVSNGLKYDIKLKVRSIHIDGEEYEYNDEEIIESVESKSESDIQVELYEVEPCLVHTFDCYFEICDRFGEKLFSTNGISVEVDFDEESQFATLLDRGR